MIRLNLERQDAVPPTILCLGAHADDIEIGCGGLILRLAEQYPDCTIHWVVFSALSDRKAEAQLGAELFAGSRLKTLSLRTFPDGFMPYVGGELKLVFERELKQLSPDLILTHHRGDAHQDHRLISELTWNTFRDHLILEYEIPKYDGDLGQPSVFVPLEMELSRKKVRFITDTFQSQRGKHWFEATTFFSLMRLRGIECRAAGGHAEAFFCRKLVL
jgi:LmbE family N-acetylglucosaminyl deacetylase